jgi:hypothetical protein
LEEEGYRLILKIKRRIETLDRMVFGNNTIPTIIISPFEIEDDWIAAYLWKKGGNQEFYAIAEFSDKALIDIFRIEKEMNWIDKATSLDTFLLRTAVHEVRHRAQRYFPIILFSELKKGKIKNSAIKSAVDSAIKIYYKKFSKMRSLKEKMEFDAIVITEIASQIWERSKKLSKVAEIVKLNADEIGEIDPLFYSYLRLTSYQWSLFNESPRSYCWAPFSSPYSSYQDVFPIGA